ncbi:hypothetical protein LSH36_155g07016 [Paralvinella palmiformis]|uniref:Nucleotide-diphospho-sugar transferase domain-containing protein n=1 Tax=Paralvinella palmiformis TaxID=53620 RepID=A0AAD9JVN4_9ANNE|nr:hypothetical protein LSH36_155g07016 [Paralvinella palmiformis]
MKVLRRGALARTRLVIIRVLAFLTAAGVISLFVYWRGLNTGHLITLGNSRRTAQNVPWERSAALRTVDVLEDDPEDYDDDDLVTDTRTNVPDDTATLEFNIDQQLQQDILEFGQELESLGIPTPEQEDRHIGVERKELQPWELEVEDLYEEDKEYDDDLTVDDHIPGLVEDTRQPGSSDAEDFILDREHSLLEDDLEAVARLAEEDAMRDAEEREWAKLGDVDEVDEWKSEADVDWDREEAELVEESRKQILEQEEEEEEEDSRAGKRRTKTSKERTAEENADEEEEDEEQQDEGEMTTLEATTAVESVEEVAIEEAEEAEIFGQVEQRKIERILVKLGIGRSRRLRYALEKTANRKREIIITLSDSRYTMLTLNFYENTVLKLGLTNVLFASLDGRLCNKLDALNIPCFLYARAPITGADVERGVRKIFNSKIYLRARLILEALAMGYSVAYVDTDTMLLKNPFPALKEECHGKCDVAFQQMTNASRRLSWGVVYARPSLSSLYLFYALVKKTANRTIALPDRFISRLDREGKLQLVRLPLWRFRSGIDYFSYVKFAWDDRCIGCVSIHCDETLSKDGKIYRMKELLRWNLDMEGYYSKRRRKYIAYDNPYVFHNGTETLIMEMRALRNALALGHILRRVVILPKFHCYVPPPPPPVDGESDPELPPLPPTKWCNIHDILRIEDFHRWYMGHYREHSFLAHRKVPRPLKRNISATFYIGHKMPEEPGDDVGTSVEAVNVTIVKPRSPLYGAHAEEIRSLFEHEDAAILRFHSLYYGFSHFLSDDVARGFNRKIKFGFVFRTRVRYNVRKLKVRAPERRVPGQPVGIGPGLPGASILAPPGHLMAQAQAMAARGINVDEEESPVDGSQPELPPADLPIEGPTQLSNAPELTANSPGLARQQQSAPEMFIPAPPRAPHQPEKTDMFLPSSTDNDEDDVDDSDKEKLLPSADIPLKEEEEEIRTEWEDVGKITR